MARHPTKLRHLHRYLTIALLLGVWASGCETIPAETPTGGVIPRAKCITSYYNERVGAGCSPPSHLLGPRPNLAPHLAENYHRIEWGRLVSGEFRADIAFSAFPTNYTTTQEAASFWAQFEASALGYVVFKHEPVMLFNGDPAWLVASRHPTLPLMRVQTIVVKNGWQFSVNAYGSDLYGTFDFDYNTAICLTLCVE